MCRLRDVLPKKMGYAGYGTQVETTERTDSGPRGPALGLRSFVQAYFSLTRCGPDTPAWYLPNAALSETIASGERVFRVSFAVPPPMFPAFPLLPTPVLPLVLIVPCTSRAFQFAYARLPAVYSPKEKVKKTRKPPSAIHCWSSHSQSSRYLRPGTKWKDDDDVHSALAILQPNLHPIS